MNTRTVPLNPESVLRQSVSASVDPKAAGDRPNESLGRMFDLAATIEGLCTKGIIDQDCVQSVEPQSFLTEGQALEPFATVVLETSSPAFDVLSNNFVQAVVNFIASISHRSVGLLVTSKSGAVVHSAHSGWDASDFRMHGRVLATIAKESVWRLEPRFSTNAIAEEFNVAKETAAAAPVVNVETSACLNELAKIVGTPLFAIPFELQESGGFAVFLCDATPCIEYGIPEYFRAASQLWLPKASLESLIRQVDTWRIVRRCSWLTRVVSFLESIRSKPKWWLSALGIFFVALLAPIPYYPSRDCVFEPETKQYLSSPIQGRIASCEVRPGDPVEKGQLMARIDDDQLSRDLAAAKAEFDAARKKRDSALATKATGNVGLADIEMNQAKWRIESIQDQLQRLEIRATSSGIVVQGDWQRNVGMPLTLGQSLFEVAELESMTAEVRLLSSDLAQINVGDEVSVRSDASGIATFRGKISRIEPRATVIDDAAVFVADVVIRDPELQLRPGMKATAQIKAGWRSLGWYLFHRPYRWIANQWIW